MKHKVTVAGEGSGISVTTMHDSGNPFDRTFASSELFGSSGVNFAIVDGYSTIEASLRGRGQFIQPGMYKTHKIMVCNLIYMYMPYIYAYSIAFEAFEDTTRVLSDGECDAN